LWKLVDDLRLWNFHKSSTFGPETLQTWTILTRFCLISSIELTLVVYLIHQNNVPSFIVVQLRRVHWDAWS
jgi:hypothetical protein